MPFPGALCVPPYLDSIVPLSEPVEKITSNFHSQLRRDLKKNRTRYRLQQVLDSADIEHAHNDDAPTLRKRKVWLRGSPGRD